jgi:hypothetical protein
MTPRYACFKSVPLSLAPGQRFATLFRPKVTKGRDLSGKVILHPSSFILQRGGRLPPTEALGGGKGHSTTGVFGSRCGGTGSGAAQPTGSSCRTYW